MSYEAPDERSAREAGARARIRVLALLTFLLFVALTSRLWFLQVLAADRYEGLAQGNRFRELPIEAPRGRILDREGRVLVKNRVAWEITILASDLGPKRTAVLDRLAKLLGTTRPVIERRLHDYNGSPLVGVPVAKDVEPRVLFYLAEHPEQFPGVGTGQVALRDYPLGSLAAHVLGYVGEISGEELRTPAHRAARQGDIVGKAGVEQSYDQFLHGKNGVERVEVDSLGHVVSVAEAVPPVPGTDLRLTIDVNIQHGAELALLEGMRAARARFDPPRRHNLPAPAGTAIVLNPRDGSVLALASLPQYDPRKFVGGISERDFAAYSNDPGRPLLDRAISSVYPAGSTWKPITALAALRNNLITPGTTINDPGYFQFGDRIAHNAESAALGTVNLNTALVLSSDVYFYRIGAGFAAREQASELAGRKPFEAIQTQAREVGFGEAPPLDLPFAADGTVPDRAWKKRYWEANKSRYCAASDALNRYLCQSGYVWQGGDDLNIATGQGDIQVSPLQLADAYAALGNGGVLWRPHVGLGSFTRAGEVVRTVPRQVVSKITAAPAMLGAVRNALEQVTVSGTAQAAFAGFPLDRFQVAGKTGTAEMPPRSPFAWFASYAPATSPRYAVAVMVEEGGYGGQTSAPVVRQIYERLFHLPIHPIVTTSQR